MRILVADDGCGFDPDAVGSGHGLRGMRERVESLGGEIVVDSAPSTGTRVTARLPISPGSGAGAADAA